MIDLDGLHGGCAPIADLLATRSHPPLPGSYRFAENRPCSTGLLSLGPTAMVEGATLQALAMQR